MHKYRVAWLDHYGNRHESTVENDDMHKAELAVWEANQECLGIINTVQVTTCVRQAG